MNMNDRNDAKTIPHNRHIQILDVLSKQGRADVTELSNILRVSPVTIRRDLDFLDNQGFLIRTHGGATVDKAVNNLLPERVFAEKDIANSEEKHAICKKAMSLIHPDDTLFVNSGSTALWFIKTLHGIRAKIFTNNARAIGCRYDPSIELMLLGGEYREQSQSFVGFITLQGLEGINSTHTILGTNGISVEKGLTTTVLSECAVNQAMIKNTKGKVIVLADHSKVGYVSNFVSAPLDSVDVLVTDSGCKPEILEQFKDYGIEVLVADTFQNEKKQ
jgi:DeoR/GlpR family transcriptional regulator of sugar metabolism